MELRIFQIDAFTEKLFSGNPAAVVPLKKWLPPDVMQNIALENNLSETAFFVPEGDGFHIRWFTPVTEVLLCGHATLASSHVIFNYLDPTKKQVRFSSKSGFLNVKREKKHIVLDFPASGFEEIPLPENTDRAFDTRPRKCFRGREDLLFRFQREEDIRLLRPRMEYLKTFDARGIIITAASRQFDFVSRFFAPLEGIDEDPVTGSAHTMLVPFWADQLNRKKLVAKQISKRGGILYCRHSGDRVEIGGKAATYMTGRIHLDTPY